MLCADKRIEEAAAVAVPDAKYGEVVGVWIVRSKGSDMTREQAKRIVADYMNPQVRVSFLINSRLTWVRMPPHGYGLWVRMDRETVLTATAFLVF